MNTKPVDAIANAVLYEGYMLYPYRASSVKNRQRFNFGVLYPESYSAAQMGTDASSMQTECLVEGGLLTTIEVKVRFLKVVERLVRTLADPAGQPERTRGFEPLPVPEFANEASASWQEAIECEVAVPDCNLVALEATPVKWEFAFPAKEESELSRDDNGRYQALVTRKQQAVQGIVEVSAVRVVEDGLFKLRVRLINLTSFGVDDQATRDQALTVSLVSAHTLLGVVDGRFFSLLEPPESLNDLVQSCQNVGTWPVLIGAAGDRDTMLSSPIILYDYPQIAPESPVNLFDGTEIDEILALRILAMTDEEKREMRDTDDRARRMLERTEALPKESLMRLHGTLRELRALKEEMS